MADTSWHRSAAVAKDKALTVTLGAMASLTFTSAHFETGALTQAWTPVL